MLRKFRPQARQVFDMNFLGFSLIDVSGVTVVCSPLFFRNNGSRRRERPLIPWRVAGTLVYNETPPRSSQSRGGKRRSIEILAVLKINYGMSARMGETGSERGGGIFPR